MYVMHKPTRWEEYFHLVEFTYNNGKQTYMGMILFKVMYGRRCRTLVSWDNRVNKITLGPHMLRETKQEVAQIKYKLKISEDRQKSYVDQNQVDKEFEGGDYVYLWFKPNKSLLKLGSHPKLPPHYCDPFEIIKRIGHVAYKLALLVNVKVHEVFHVPLLNKYVYILSHSYH